MFSFFSKQVSLFGKNTCSCLHKEWHDQHPRTFPTVIFCCFSMFELGFETQVGMLCGCIDGNHLLSSAPVQEDRSCNNVRRRKRRRKHASKTGTLLSASSSCRSSRISPCHSNSCECFLVLAIAFCLLCHFFCCVSHTMWTCTHTHTQIIQ